MTKRLVAVPVALLLGVGLNATVASAHANLLRSNIKNNAVFHAGHVPRSVQGFFAERLDPNKSWMAVFEGAADHGLVTEKQRSVVNYLNPEEMILKLPKLHPDKYYLMWYTRSAVDGHYAAGIVYFQVRK